MPLTAAEVDAAVRARRLAIELVAKILKRKFNNLSVEETITLAFDVVEAVEAAHKETT